MPEPEVGPRVCLYQEGRSVALLPGLNETELRESQLLFAIHSPVPVRAFFDDQQLSIVWSEQQRSGYGQLDLTNQVGFHRFLLRTASRDLSFDFRTTTAKATRDEIEAMARVVADQVFSFKRQFVYAHSNGKKRIVPVPEVAIGWLRERVDEIGRLVRSIDARPATQTRQKFSTSHQARDVSVPRTLRLVRETPGLLEALPGGPLTLGSLEYWPAAVVVRRRDREPAHIEHMQLAHFLFRVARLITDLRSAVPPDILSMLTSWDLSVRAVREARIVKAHEMPNTRAAWTPLPTQLQKTEPRYRRAREIHSEFLQDIDIGEHWENAMRVNVRDAWEIYQAFVAHMIGRAFGLRYVSQRKDLRERASGGFSMHSGEYELFYDCRAPSEAMPSWRDATVRPGGERPDIVLRQRSNGALAVLDVKFKVDQDGTSAKGEDLFEMQGYLNSFSLTAGAIVFPGALSVPRFLTGKGITLAEIPLRASFFLIDPDGALAILRTAIEKVLRVSEVGLAAGTRSGG